MARAHSGAPMSRFSTGLAVVLATLTLVGTASAADLARKGVNKPIEYTPRAYDWTGFYAGVNAGYGFDATDKSGTSNDGGFVGGGQIGYNWQLNQFVFGVEADIQYADLETKYNGTGYKDGINWFGTVRARAGYAVDKYLVYATGGFAYGGADTSGTGGDDTRTGWTVGGGLEYAFTSNITGRIEGLYVSLERDSSRPSFVDKNQEFGVIRAGVNFKFNTF